jgi:hypothetical protein
MHLNDLQSEWAFYGRELNIVGHLYMPAAEQPSRYPDALFFCLYTARLLVDKKISLSAAVELQKRLRLGAALERCVSWEEDREYTPPARLIPYKGYTKSVLSATLLFRDKLHFRFGYAGFGFFSNGRRFDFCAGASVFALLETIYNTRGKDKDLLAKLWRAAALMGGVVLGEALNRGNCLAVGKQIYAEATGDQFPALTR